jgi:glycosyltransferase involved in cell wall biosynthesis
MGPLITVIMAAYNAGDVIAHGINSILSQSYGNYELIIIDDASVDNTADIINSFDSPHIRLIQNVRNLKQNLSRNIGIDAANGQYIAICDADDICLPTRLAAQVNYLETHPDVDVVGSNAYIINNEGDILGGLIIKHTEHRDLVRNIHRGGALLYTTIMARSQWMRKYKYPDDYHGQAEDQEMFLRAYKESIFANIPEFLYAYRDPGLNPRKLLISIYHNSIMRWRNWRDYGCPAKNFLAFPIIVAGRLLYYGVAKACGRSVMWAHTRPLEANHALIRDQRFIRKLIKETIP